MNDFLIGKILRIEENAVYNDTVYDFFLEIQVNNQIIKVFDFSPSLSQKNSENSFVQLVVVLSFPQNLKMVEPGKNVFSSLNIGKISRIVNFEHDLQNKMLRFQLFNNEWYLINTLFGGLLISKNELSEFKKSELVPGTDLTWESGRFDLYGILSLNEVTP
jgi:hypothetical protein